MKYFFRRILLLLIGPLPDPQKRFGKYRGTVIENQDPKNKGQIQVRLPSIPEYTHPIWATPCLPPTIHSRPPLYQLPEVGASVWIEFEEGDVQNPIWVGNSTPVSEYPGSQGSNSSEPTHPEPNCCQFIVCDATLGKEYLRLFHPRESEIVLEPNGSVLLKDSSGNMFRLDFENNRVIIEDINGNTFTQNTTGTQIEDSSGNTVIMDSEGITLEAPEIILKSSKVRLGGSGGEKVLLGKSFLDLFATHIHTSAPVVGGPSSPPIPQGEATSLSTQVKAN